MYCGIFVLYQLNFPEFLSLCGFQLALTKKDILCLIFGKQI